METVDNLNTAELSLTKPRGISLLRKSVRDFFRTKGFLRIFDGFFLQTKGFFAKGVRDFLE